MNENRRQSIRISGGHLPCQVIINGTCGSGVVIDESIHGLSVGRLDLVILLQDQPIEVKLENEHVIGKCRSVARDDAGLFRVGIRKQDEPQPPSNNILLNSYMNFGGCNVVCLPIKVVDEEHLLIRLLDGKEFAVTKNQLKQLTRAERTAELKQDRQLFEQIRSIYAAMSPGLILGSVDRIIEQEFGIIQPALAAV